MPHTQETGPVHLSQQAPAVPHTAGIRKQNRQGTRGFSQEEKQIVTHVQARAERCGVYGVSSADSSKGFKVGFLELHQLHIG